MAHSYYTTGQVQLDIERNQRSEPVHSPLESGYGQIRLLRVCPTAQGSPIRGELAEYALDQNIRYTALSYQWGPAQLDAHIVSIMINNRLFWIRRNLWQFLDRVRQTATLYERSFWIDTVCVNQAANDIDSVNEKCHQVNIMGKIYSEARRVICWLGEPDPSQLPCLRDLVIYFTADQVSAKLEDSALQGLHYILDLPYWTRIWVVQEIVLAKRVTVMCGTFYFSWHKILNLWNNNASTSHFLDPSVTPRHVQPSSDSRDPSASKVAWGKAKRIVQWSSHEPNQDRGIDLTSHSAFLLDILQTFEHQECSNPSDKIYGLLGLMDRKVLMPDYSITVEKLFQNVLDVADAYLAHEQDTFRGNTDAWKYESVSRTFLMRYFGLENVKEVAYI